MPIPRECLTKHNERAHWVYEWLKRHGGAAASDDEFNGAFYEKFGGATSATLGSLLARRVLKQMYDDGYLDRSRIGNQDARSEDRSTWEYHYFVSGNMKRFLREGGCYYKAMFQSFLEDEPCPHPEHETVAPALAGDRITHTQLRRTSTARLPVTPPRGRRD